MKMLRRIVLVVALLGTALLLKGAVPLQAAPQDQAKETKKEDDSRYYIHVNGITWPTWLTNVVKQLRQLAGVDQVKVTDFKKGVFAITPKKGAELSEAALRDAIKRSGFTTEKIVTPKGASAKRQPAAEPTTKAAEKAAASKDSGQAISRAREVFRQRDYHEALRLARRAAQEKPRDSQIQQLVALTHFALGEYDDSASAAHTALHLGEHWDSKELSQLYSDTRDYTAQLKRLEQYVRENSSSGQAHFLLGYHYLMREDSKAARSELALAAKLDPEDELVARLLKQLDKEREGREQ